MITLVFHDNAISDESSIAIWNEGYDCPFPIALMARVLYIPGVSEARFQNFPREENLRASKGHACLGEIDIIKDTPFVKAIAFPNYGVCWEIMGIGIGTVPIWLGRTIVVQFENVAMVRVVAVGLRTVLVCGRRWEAGTRWEKP